MSDKDDQTGKEKDDEEEKTKQGKQNGPITKKTATFKGGVEGTKGCITCDDLLK